MRIGVLALQGAFAEHCAVLRKLDTESFEIRQKRDLEQDFDGLILVGGESTVMGQAAAGTGLHGSAEAAHSGGMPVFGTCAGLILLAKQVEGGLVQFGTMDIAARRNAYGRQLGSFETTAQMQEVGEIPMVFIRAPYIASGFGGHPCSGGSGRKDRRCTGGKPAGHSVPSGADR